MRPGIKKLSYAKYTVAGVSTEMLGYKDEIKPMYLMLGCAARRNALSDVKHLLLENLQQTQTSPALQSPQASRQSSSSCLRLYPASISHNNRVLRHYSAASLGPLLGDRVLRIVNVTLGIFSITSCRVDDPCYTTSRLHREGCLVLSRLENETSTRSFENQRAGNAKGIVGNVSCN